MLHVCAITYIIYCTKWLSSLNKISIEKVGLKGFRKDKEREDIKFYNIVVFAKFFTPNICIIWGEWDFWRNLKPSLSPHPLIFLARNTNYHIEEIALSVILWFRSFFSWKESKSSSTQSRASLHRSTSNDKRWTCVSAWFLGWFMCKAVAYIQGVSVAASVYSLVAVSLDRYVHVHIHTCIELFKEWFHWWELWNRNKRRVCCKNYYRGLLSPILLFYHNYK